MKRHVMTIGELYTITNLTIHGNVNTVLGDVEGTEVVDPIDVSHQDNDHIVGGSYNVGSRGRNTSQSFFSSITSWILSSVVDGAPVSSVPVPLTSSSSSVPTLSLVIVRSGIGVSESEMDRSGTAINVSGSRSTIDSANCLNDHFHCVCQHQDIVIHQEELMIFFIVLGVWMALTDGFLFIKVIDPFLQFLMSRKFPENLFDVWQWRSELMCTGIPLSLIED